MKGDFSKIPDSEFDHYVGVLLQQGRVQIDSDWNEQVILQKNIIEKNFASIMGDSYCTGDSFLVADKIPIDSMANPVMWRISESSNPNANISASPEKPEQASSLYYSKGSLLIKNASEIERNFESLDLSRSKSVSLEVKLATANLAETSTSTKNLDGTEVAITLHVTINGKKKQFMFTKTLNHLSDKSAFHNLNFPLDQNHCARTGIDSNEPSCDFDISQVSKISIRWTPSTAIHLCNLSVEPLIAIVTGDPTLRRYPWINVNEDDSMMEADIQKKYNGKPAIKKPLESYKITCTFPISKNFNSIKRITFSSDTFIKPNLMLCSETGVLYEIPVDAFESEKEDSAWNTYFCDLEHATSSSNEIIDLSKIKSLILQNLPTDEFYMSEILGEVNFENDFIVLGSSLLKQKPGQMYVGGILCEKEYFDTYLNQSDYPASVNLFSDYDSNIYETSAKKQFFLIYADVWQRGITYVEDPRIREVALGGPDTATRIKTVCQTKALEIPAGDDFQKSLQREENNLQNMIKKNSPGLLSVFSTSRDNGQDGENNSLYRIQIHDGGNGKDGLTTFKWSSDNASTFFPLKSIERFSISFMAVGRRLDNLFQIGDIIEISDDSIDLSDNPRGHVRRITNIDLDDNSLSWASSESEDITDVDSLNDAVSWPYVESFHPKLIKWNGVKRIQVKEEGSTDIITLTSDESEKIILSSQDHGIKLKFYAGQFRTGDYWNFTVRALDGSVEKMRYRGPSGPKHSYVKLGLIEKEQGKPFFLLDDLRKKTNVRIGSNNTDPSELDSLSNPSSIFRTGAYQGEQVSTAQPYTNFGRDYTLDKGLRTKISFEHLYDCVPFLSYTVKTKYGEDVAHKIEDIENNNGCEGFFITAEENSVLNWMSIGKSSPYEKDSVKKTTENMLKLIFGDKAAETLTTGDENSDDYWRKKIKKLLK